MKRQQLLVSKLGHDFQEFSWQRYYDKTNAVLSSQQLFNSTKTLQINEEKKDFYARGLKNGISDDTVVFSPQVKIKIQGTANFDYKS